MATIPTLRQIAANFRRNVQLESWRRRRDPASAIVNFTGAQKDLFDHLMRIMAGHERERRKAVGSLRTAKDVLRRGARVRRILREVQGLAKFPPRTPLRAKVTGGFVRDGFCVQHVILQSRPGLYVTGNMYLPTRFRPPLPAVLHVCGHTENGKAGYQRMSALLATKGFAVFCFDPAGQGERDEYVDIATGRRTVRRACRSHEACGDAAYLLGTNFGEHRLWDCIRCVDYLRGRRDIIASRIGVTGMSGGGWESLWLGAIDTRIRAINSNLYTTTFRRRMENRGQDAEGDPEQDPFGLLARGIDAADLLVACLPRPVSLGATRGDYFPFDGAMATYRDARRMFDLAGMGERLAITVDDGGHEMTTAMRRQTCRWMLRWLKGEQEPDDTDIEVPDEPEERTFCTKTGIVLTSLGGVTTSELNARRARELAIRRTKQTAGMAPARRAGAVRRKLADLLRYQPPSGPLRVEEDEPTRVGGPLFVTPLRIKADDGLWVSGHLWQINRDAPYLSGNPWKNRVRPYLSSKDRPAVVYLGRKDAGHNPFASEFCASLARSGTVVLDLDVRGMGPVAEQWLDFTPLVEGDLTYDSFLLGRPVMGMRVADVVRGVEYLLAREDVDPRRVGVHGRHYTALLALLAGCLDRRIKAVFEEEPLASWSSLAWHRDYAWGVDMVLPGALEHFDLADVRAAVAPRKLSVRRPLDHHKKPLSPPAVREEFAAARRAFAAAGAERNLVISTSLPPRACLWTE